MQPVQVCRTTVCMLSVEALHRAPDNSIACCHNLEDVLGPDKQRQSVVFKPCLTALPSASRLFALRGCVSLPREPERDYLASKSDHI